MSGLADWVMKKRINAIISVAAFSVIPIMFWLSAAILGLVVLRKGVSEGIPVFAWGGLPALLLWYFQGDATALMVLFDTLLLAFILRLKVSWSWVLLSASWLAIISSWVYPLIMRDMLEFITELSQQVIANQKDAVELSKETIFQLSVTAISVVQVYIAVAALFLARRWQASLYNPGGFKREFHMLRLPVVFALVLVTMVLIGESLEGSFEIFAKAAIPALVLPGLALVHGILAKKRIGLAGLVLFYLIGIFVLNVYFLSIVMVLAIIDSFVDIRSRIKANPSGSNES
ncbi:hypothetical protein [Marinomonas balearica]|uniref:DUF2232 domain-containing protein n=1 Tax=Marinomonas balearica TaxID=491947 RepID=A0A4R6M9S5_9GAMM|nr:hypothetical protein [Marinomonas balearica]TDO98267.1 hypothetical protein DFP79_1908 [Marinomonas balearica]